MKQTISIIISKTGKKKMTKQPSISLKLHDDLGALISTIPPGGRLPSEPKLALQLGVSRATLREAMRTFETQGILRRRQGSGTFVTYAPHIFESGLEVLESIETLSKRIGLKVTMGECNIVTRSGNQEETKALGISDNAPVVSIERVILADDRPVAYLIDVLPQNIISESELTNQFSGSILDLLLQRGSPNLEISRTEINAVTAAHDIAKSMGIQRGDVLLRFIAYLYDSNNHVVDYSYSFFLPGFFNFHVVRRVGKNNTKN
jgi:GntR family transcriptional regulator